MGVGLVALQVAEKKRRKSKRASEKTDVWLDEPVAAPVSAPVLTEAAVFRESPRRTSFDISSYDKEAWRRLVESDADLLHLTSILAEYGEHYVDELAKCYLAGVNDKTRVPAIVESIIAAAKRQASRRTRSRPMVDQQSLASAAASSQNDQPNDRFSNDASRVATGRAKVDVPLNEALNEPSVSVVNGETSVDPTQPSQRRRSTTITSADADLAELIRKFAPDSTFLLKK
jgi:hypothetical protein